MRALCLTATGGPQHLALREIAPPGPPGPDEVQVAMRAIALNHLDLWVAEGLPGVPLPTLPHVVGCDGAGEIRAVGESVQHVAIGDRVVINPGWGCGTCEACLAGDDVYCRQFGVMGEHRAGVAAEWVNLPARAVTPIRGVWSWAEAAAFPLATLTAWRMLVTRARVQADETVLIWGIGGGVAIAGPPDRPPPWCPRGRDFVLRREAGAGPGNGRRACDQPCRDRRCRRRSSSRTSGAWGRRGRGFRWPGDLAAFPARPAARAVGW